MQTNPDTKPTGVIDAELVRSRGSRVPKDVIDRLFAANQKAMLDETVRKRLGDGGVEVVTSASPEEFMRFIAKETERWAKVIRDADIPIE